MDHGNSRLVGYDEWVLTTPSGPYPAGTRWAQPHVDEAAAHMRQLYENPDDARELGARAREHIRDTRTQHALARFVQGRLEEIRMTERPATDGAWDEPLPGPLQDAINYDATRRAASRGAKGRAVERLVKPYSAPADAMIGRLLATDEWVFTNGERRARSIERRLDEVEKALVRLDSETRVVGQRAHDDLVRAMDNLSDRLYPPLYMDEPGAFVIAGDDGSPVLGYATGDGGVASAETYADFEDVFRGPPERLTPGLTPYIALLDGHAPILDVGCGRGEMLRLLAEAGLQASGVDSDAGMVSRARQAGLDVTEGDATTYLSDSVAAASLGAIFSAQVVEHIPWPALSDFLAASHAALRPGGIFIAETVNPHCLQALKAFWLDPTHQHPLFPEAMLVFCRQAGFSRAWIRFSAHGGDLEEARRNSSSYAVVAFL
jgi:2-polyprenyl-3-methyl-5-hydroxy-6-metoxy-1,4-benzoquinol methylase